MSGMWSADGGTDHDQRVFYSLHPVNGTVSGDQVRPVLTHFSLPQDQLASIWRQVDRDGDGRINLAEFCQAMSLIRQSKSSPLSSLSQWSSPTSTGFGSSTSGFGSSTSGFGSSTSGFGSSTSRFGSSTSGFGSSTSGFGSSTSGFGSGTSGFASSTSGFGSMSGGSSTAGLALLPQDKQRFSAMFTGLSKVHSDYLSASEAQTVLVKSDLSRDKLHQIWDLADVDKDGQLSRDEFVIAMFLVERAKQGIPLPSTLPPHLKPATTSSSSSSPGGSFEDRRRAHFEQGRLELERRRRELQEQQEREKEEKERKRREEQERKEQQEREAMRLRQIELDRQRQRAMEIEREREMERQRVALQLEAQARDAERKRKEEWAKKRQAELEQQLKQERDSLQTIKHTHQELVDTLARLDMDKGGLSVRMEQQRQLCKQLAATLDRLRQVIPPHRNSLSSMTTQLTSQRELLTRLQLQHRNLQQPAMDETSGSCKERIMEDRHKIDQLTSTVAALKIERAQKKSDVDNLSNGLRERNSSLMNMQAELRQQTRNNKQLKDKLMKRQEQLNHERAAETRRQQKLTAAKQKATQYKETIAETRVKRLSLIDQSIPATQPVPTTRPVTSQPVPTTRPVTSQPVPTTRPVTFQPVPTTRPVTSQPVPTSRPVTSQPVPTTRPVATSQSQLSENDVLQKVKQLQEKKKMLQKQKKESGHSEQQRRNKPSLPPKPKSVLFSPLPKPPSPIPTSNPISEQHLAHAEPLYDMPPLEPPTQTAIYDVPPLEPATQTAIYDIPPLEPARQKEAIYDDPEMVVKTVANRNTAAAASTVSSTAAAAASDVSVQYRARYSFTAGSDTEVSFHRGAILVGMIDDEEEGWIKVRHGSSEGWVPTDYLDPIDTDPVAATSSARGSTSTAPSSPSPTSAPSSLATVLFSWDGAKPNHLSIVKDESIKVLQHGTGWLMGEGPGGKVGWFPESYVQIIDSDQQLTETPPPASPQQLTETPPPASPQQLTEMTSSEQQLPNRGPSPEVVIATYSYSGQTGDLSFSKGDRITVLNKDGDWWTGEIAGVSGVFPSTYVHSAPQAATTAPQAATTAPQAATTAPQAATTAPQAIPHVASTSSLTDPSLAMPSPSSSKRLVGRVVAMFEAQQAGQLSLSVGQLVLVRQQQTNGWWEGELQSRGQSKQTGWFPANRIQLLASSGSSGSLKPIPRVPRSPSPQPEPQGPVAGSLVLALYTYQANSSDELSFHKGSVITVTSKEEEEWWKGELNGQTGLFPCNYVQSLDILPVVKPEAKRWSDYVSNDIFEKVPRETRKRQEAIFELVSSEKSYVNSLNLVKEVFFDPMAAHGVLPPQEHNQVVVNWDELIECNSALCNAMFIRLRMSGAIVRNIGDVLVEHIPKLHPHIRWCSCQLNACKLLQQKSSDPLFKEFEQQCLKDQRTGGLPLSSFLLKPMQRITKYPLLIKRVIEHTVTTDPDIELLELALQKSEELCSQVNERVREQENTDRLEWLQSHVQLNLSERLVFNSQTNFMGARKLLHWGKLTKVRGNKEFVVLLFNDFLMLLSRPKGLFTSFAELEPFTTDHNFTLYRQPFLLDTLKVKKMPVEQYGPSVFSLTIDNEEKDIPLKTFSDKARDKWTKSIGDAVVQYARSKKKDIRLQRSNSVRQTLVRSSIGKVFVTVVEAADLLASDPNGKSDPFCVVKLGESQEQATPVVNNCLNPRWNHTMDFVVTDLSTSVIELTVFDSDLFSPNDFLGCARVSLSDLTKDKPRGPWTKRLLLEDVTRGEIELRLALKLNR